MSDNKQSKSVNADINVEHKVNFDKKSIEENIQSKPISNHLSSYLRSNPDTLQRRRSASRESSSSLMCLGSDSISYITNFLKDHKLSLTKNRNNDYSINTQPEIDHSKNIDQFIKTFIEKKYLHPSLCPRFSVLNNQNPLNETIFKYVAIAVTIIPFPQSMTMLEILKHLIFTFSQTTNLLKDVITPYLTKIKGIEKQLDIVMIFLHNIEKNEYLLSSYLQNQQDEKENSLPNQPDYKQQYNQAIHSLINTLHKRSLNLSQILHELREDVDYEGEYMYEWSLFYQIKQNNETTENINQEIKQVQQLLKQYNNDSNTEIIQPSLAIEQNTVNYHYFYEYILYLFSYTDNPGRQSFYDPLNPLSPHSSYILQCYRHVYCISSHFHHLTYLSFLFRNISLKPNYFIEVHNQFISLFPYSDLFNPSERKLYDFLLEHYCQMIITLFSSFYLISILPYINELTVLFNLLSKYTRFPSLDQIFIDSFSYQYNQIVPTSLSISSLSTLLISLQHFLSILPQYKDILSSLLEIDLEKEAALIISNLFKNDIESILSSINNYKDHIEDINLLAKLYSPLNNFFTLCNKLHSHVTLNPFIHYYENISDLYINTLLNATPAISNFPFQYSPQSPLFYSNNLIPFCQKIHEDIVSLLSYHPSIKQINSICQYLIDQISSYFPNIEVYLPINTTPKTKDIPWPLINTPSDNKNIQNIHSINDIMISFKILNLIVDIDILINLLLYYIHHILSYYPQSILQLASSNKISSDSISSMQDTLNKHQSLTISDISLLLNIPVSKLTSPLPKVYSQIGKGLVPFCIDRILYVIGQNVDQTYDQEKVEDVFEDYLSYLYNIYIFFADHLFEHHLKAIGQHFIEALSEVIISKLLSLDSSSRIFNLESYRRINFCIFWIEEILTADFLLDPTMFEGIHQDLPHFNECKNILDICQKSTNELIALYENMLSNNDNIPLSSYTLLSPLSSKKILRLLKKRSQNPYENTAKKFVQEHSKFSFKNFF